ncbi:MAG: YCF48-related protein, partial [Ignavibacteriaceae bacterium]
MKKLNLTLKIIYLILISFGLQFNSYSQEWFIQNTSVNSSDLYSVNFIDESIGWIVGDNNTILKTTDGGETWITLTTGTEGYRNYSCYFTDINNGYVVGNSRIRKTTDGGISWSDIPIQLPRE